MNRGSAYVYVVRCADGTLYTGWTSDLGRRIAAHNRGDGAKYTRARRPVVLAGWWEAADRSEALRLEARFRRLSRREKLIAIEGKDPTWPLTTRRPATN